MTKKFNLLYIILPVFFISFLLININVTYFGDDYHFLLFSSESVSSYFSDVFKHYTLDNGRLIVHLLDSLFLKMPIIFWQILNSLMLTLICYFASKVITKDKKENMPIISTLFFFLISMLQINVTNQSIYWITGSFNYVYPMFMFFIYWYLLDRIELNNKYFILSIFIGFISAASVEQVGMMTFGLTVLYLLKNLVFFKINKKSNKDNNISKYTLINYFKDNKKLILLAVVTLIGIGTVILSPSQFKRMDIEKTKPFIENFMFAIKFIISNFSFEKNILPYMLLYNISSILFICSLKSNNKKDKIINYSFIAMHILNILLGLYGIYNFSNVLSFGLIVNFTLILINYIASIIFLNIKIYNKLISPLSISIVLMIGSQFMMIVSPVLGERNLVCGLLMFAFIIGIILSNTQNINKLYAIFIIILLCFALRANYITSKGYYETKLIDSKNIEAINEYHKNKSNSLTLNVFNNNYCWSMPYISPYHLECFKTFYNIDCDIVWQ